MRKTSVPAGRQTLKPAQDEAILRAAGFRDVNRFHAAHIWRGWIMGA
jgi:hypothetical protein